MTDVFQKIHSSAIAEPWQISPHVKQRPSDLQTSPGLRHRHHYLNHQSQSQSSQSSILPSPSISQIKNILSRYCFPPFSHLFSSLLGQHSHS